MTPGTFIVIAVIALIVGAILFSEVRKRRAGKGGCGGCSGCSGCSSTAADEQQSCSHCNSKS